MNDPLSQVAKVHEVLLQHLQLRLIESVRVAYGHHGKGIVQLLYVEPKGYAAAPAVVYHPEDEAFDSLLAGSNGAGPATRDELFDFDEQRTMAVCVTYAGNNFFYRVDLPPDVASFERAPVS